MQTNEEIQPSPSHTAPLGNGPVGRGSRLENGVGREASRVRIPTFPLLFFDIISAPFLPKHRGVTYVA